MQSPNLVSKLNIGFTREEVAENLRPSVERHLNLVFTPGPAGASFDRKERALISRAITENKLDVAPMGQVASSDFKDAALEAMCYRDPAISPLPSHFKGSIQSDRGVLVSTREAMNLIKESNWHNEKLGSDIVFHRSALLPYLIQKEAGRLNPLSVDDYLYRQGSPERKHFLEDCGIFCETNPGQTLPSLGERASVFQQAAGLDELSDQRYEALSQKAVLLAIDLKEVEKEMGPAPSVVLLQGFSEGRGVREEQSWEVVLPMLPFKGVHEVGVFSKVDPKAPYRSRAA